MKAWKVLTMVSLALVLSGVTLAQDPVNVDAGHYKVLFENATVRALKIDYAAGAKSPMHRHPDAIVVPLKSSKVRFTMPDGTSEERDLASESALYTPAATHSPTNLGTEPIDAVLIEFKAPAPGKAEIPMARPGLGIKVLAEGRYGAAHRITAEPTFQEPPGSKHDYDQVVIALGPSSMWLSIDGKPPKTTWSRGEVTFIGRDIPHEGKNLGDAPADYVIIAIK
jgi:quercetin dioxygenase-like cupin family protein